MKAMFLLLLLSISCCGNNLQEELLQQETFNLESAITREYNPIAVRIPQLPVIINGAGIFNIGSLLSATEVVGTSNPVISTTLPISISHLFTSAIIINASNVVVDLNGLTLQGVGYNMSVQQTGIVVSPGVSNVVIRNGRLASFFTGIFIGNGNTAVNNISIYNMQLISNGTSLSATNISNFFISNCEALFAKTGFIIKQGTNGVIENCISENNNGYGFALTNCSNLLMENLIANNNAVDGFNLQSSIKNSGNITYRSCVADNNQNGFNIADTSNNLLFCDAARNIDNGFLINNNLQAILNCTAKANTTGFNLNGNNHILLNGLVQNNKTGILLGTSCNFCQIRNNTINNNVIGLNYLNPPPYVGPPSYTILPNKIYANLASNNGTNYIGLYNNYTVQYPTTAGTISFTANIDD